MTGPLSIVRFGIIGVFLAFGLSIQAAAAAANPTPEQLLAHYQRTVTRWSASVSLDINSLTVLPDITYHKKALFRYDANSLRAEWIWELVNHEETGLKKIVVLNGDMLITADRRKSLRGGRFSGFLTRRKKGEGSGDADQSSRIVYEKILAEELAESQWGGFLRGRTIAFDVEAETDLVGYLLTQCSSLAIMGTEEIRGQTCYVLRGIGKYDGEETQVWIAPAMDHNILKYKQSRPDSSMVPQSDRRNPNVAFKRWDVISQINDFVKIDDIHVPVSGEFRELKAGVQIRRVTVEQEHIVVNPDFEAMGAFSTASFPDGTLIGDYDDFETRYVMQGGQLVPYMSNSNVDELQEVEFKVEPIDANVN